MVRVGYVISRILLLCGVFLAYPIPLCVFMPNPVGVYGAYLFINGLILIMAGGAYGMSIWDVVMRTHWNRAICRAARGDYSTSPEARGERTLVGLVVAVVGVLFVLASLTILTFFPYSLYRREVFVFSF